MKQLSKFVGLFLWFSWLLAGCATVRYVAPLEPAPVMVERNLPIFNDAVGDITAVAAADLYTTPWDATPDPDAESIYFTAETAEGGVIFHVHADGTTEVVANGAPLMTPYALTISHDGSTLYVADLEASAVFAIPMAEGSEPTMVAGTEGTDPRSLEVAVQDGVEVLFISGVAPADGSPALLLTVPGSGAVQTIWSGAPLTHPEGIAIDANNTIYVADRLNGDMAQIYRLQNGEMEAMGEPFGVGRLIGAALTPDDALLLVSALNPATGTAEVMVLNTVSGEQGLVDKTIGENHGSGGVHRAHNAAVYAWSDLSSGGSVYRIPLRP